MSTLKFIRARSGSRDGVALVMVLAFIVLLTILIVSFITFTRLNRLSTASYSKSIQAEEVAEGGLQDILSDVHSEIIAGSIADPTGSTYTQGTNADATVYIPSTNYTAAPARLGYTAASWGSDFSATTLSPTLVRVSRAAPDGGTDLYPPLNATYYANMGAVPGGAILNRASAANSSTNSANGREVSASRWNKSFMLAATTLTNGASGTDAQIPTDFTQDTPDWIYVTRTGSRVCTAAEVQAGSLSPSTNLTANYGTITPGSNPPASPVVGRYAYVMYDEGALLDVNAAGYVSSATNLVSGVPPVSTSLVPQTVRNKSYLADADLTQLSGSVSAADIDSLIEWRNASIAASGSINGVNYLNAVFSYAQNGFLAFQSGDSPLVSRQDLINYFANAEPYSSSTSHGRTTTHGFNTATPAFSLALPYLGTFSRALSAPSWFPPADASVLGGNNGTGNIYAYHTNAETATVNGNPNPNRDLANVRFANSGTITHYTDDAGATPLTYTVSAGDPLLQTRFSLAKIAWLSQANPVTGAAPTNTAAIQACFGLVWGSPGSTTTNSTHSTSTANGGNPCWNYVGSPAGSGASATPFNGTIETLDQVAAENREPNFFELLKAAILSGSLGKDPGPAAYANGTANSGNPPYNAGGSGGGTANQFGNSSFYSHTLGPSTTARAPAVVPDVQIMRIGANIIDQFDADSYPTAIYFKYLTIGTEPEFDPVSGTALNPGLYGTLDMIYGDENLPDIEEVVSTWFTTAGNGTTGNSGGPTDPGGWADYQNVTAMAGFYVPQIWNPHQQPATTLTNIPQNFQIRAYGSAMSFWQYQGTGLGYAARVAATGKTNIQDSSPVTDYFQGLGGSAEVSANGTINFTDTKSGGASCLYATPILLTSDQLSGSGLTVSSPQPNNMASSYISGGTYPPYYSKVHVVGFCAGISTDFYADWTVVDLPGGGTATKPVNGTVDIEASSPPAITYVLGWLDGSTSGTGNFHPYCFINGAFTFGYNVIGSGGNINDYVGSCFPDDETPYPWYVADPRTSHFGTSGSIFGAIGAPPDSGYLGATLFSAAGTSNRKTAAAYNPQGTGFFPVGTSSNNGPANPSDWAVNSSTAIAASGEVAPVSYYSDPDGVVRPGDGYYGNAATGDGMPLFSSAAAPTPGGDTFAVGDSGGNTQHGRRPIILNRPFRDVGELGYTFRDLPFKTLDFFSQYSADAALLDVFSVTDEARIEDSQVNSMVAGEVDLDNAPIPVVQALLSGGSKKDLDPTYNIGAELPATAVSTTSLATGIAHQLSPTSTGTNPGPLLNRAGLATQLGSIVQSAFTASTDKGNKAYLEAPVRALADVTNTRTWNLMIDIIAQSGHMTPNATSLDNFVVEGEKRYWLHVAIDRYTGKIIDEQLEPVYE